MKFNKKIIKKTPKKCPSCNGDYIDCHDVDNDYKANIEYWNCGDCETVWQNHYKYSHTVIEELPIFFDDIEER